MLENTNTLIYVSEFVRNLFELRNGRIQITKSYQLSNIHNQTQSSFFKDNECGCYEKILTMSLRYTFTLFLENCHKSD